MRAATIFVVMIGLLGCTRDDTSTATSDHSAASSLTSEETRLCKKAAYDAATSSEMWAKLNADGKAAVPIDLTGSNFKMELRSERPDRVQVVISVPWGKHSRHIYVTVRRGTYEVVEMREVVFL